MDMAQFYQVLSQPEKDNSGEIRQYYSNIENRTVQYVINSDDQARQFQGQQVLVSTVASEQLMLIENTGQPVLVNQTVAYQNPQYVIQDNGIAQTAPQQQIFYMEELDDNRTALKHVQSETQPIVLNHRLQQSQMRNQISIPQQKTTIPIQLRQTPMQQLQQQTRQAQGQLPRGQVQRAGVQTQGQPSLIQHQRAAAQQRITPQGTQPNIAPRQISQQNPLRQLAAQQRTAVQGQLLHQQNSGAQQTRIAQVPQQTLAQRQIPQQSPMRQANVQNGSNTTEAVALADGRIMFLTESKQRLPDKSQQILQNPHSRTFPVQQQPPQLHLNQGQPHYVQPQFIIQPPSQHQPHTQCPLPSYVAASQIQQIIESTPVSEEYSDSIRMLVLLENGEQRLITFTLPKEVCTIQEILEQVGVPFRSDTKIECTETNNSGINYVVTVGVHNSINSQDESTASDSTTLKLDTSTSESESIDNLNSEAEAEAVKYVPGFLAVCNHCGYTSENFNRCLRCRFKLPEDVKSMPAINNSSGNSSGSDKMDEKKLILQKSLTASCKIVQAATKKRKPKVVEPEPVVLTLSSGEEDEDDILNNSKLSEAANLLKRLNGSVTLSAIRKEPSISDIQHNSLFDADDLTTAAKGGGKDEELSVSILCRTVRVGSYRYIPSDNVMLSAKGLVLKIPTPKDSTDVKTVTIERKNIVKVLVNFQKALPVIFYYVVPQVGELIREQLGMVEGGEYYFDPLSQEEAYKRITVLPEIITDDIKATFKQVYGKPFNIMDELTTKEANDILVKTCPKELTKVIVSSGYTEIRQLLIYPPGKGGLPINTEDYLCLAQDQFLNDVIIDFYLKYLILNLPKEQQDKVHVFSTFFYKRLTTKPVKASRRSHPAELDPNLTPAQKRHARVEKWTKSVNLFEKDFVIIPINENCHWFLAIICFPGMDGCVTLDGEPISAEQIKKGYTRAANAIKKEKLEKAICDDADISDRDEAEGDESELESGNESEGAETAEPVVPDKVDKNKRLPIKQSCVLIFDSLAGASRARVVATLRDYLTCEYKAKVGKERVFNKDVIKGSCPKIPQQTNFTDCGLYLLQYVEQFFKDPIQDYHIPIKHLKEWFDEFVVTKKREDISLLIKDLMIEYNKDITCLPDIGFPTLNGKLVIHSHDEEDEFMDEFEDEGEEEEEEDEELMHEDAEPGELMSEAVPAEPRFLSGVSSLSGTDLDESHEDVDLKPSESSKQCDGFIEQTVLNDSALKPDVSEMKRKTSRETLSYLKSKRISRHKSSDLTEVKRAKLSD